MALMTCHYSSSVLQRNIVFNVIVPTPASNEQVTEGEKIYDFQKNLPVAYLVHGAYGDYSSWIRYSNIERYAQDRNICVVMASAENGFYQDTAYGMRYHEFFTKELPSFIKNMFPVSTKREDTFVAGFSMGGYGAWYLALSEPQLYAKSASMSGALDIAQLFVDIASGKTQGVTPWKNIFENPDKLKGSEQDLFNLYEKCKTNGCAPKLYQTCGTEDFLYEMNISAKEKMINLGADLTYTEGHGGHDWDFWDAQIQKILDWFLERS